MLEIHGKSTQDTDWRGGDNRKSECQYAGACAATGGDSRTCKTVGRRGGENFCFIFFRILRKPCLIMYTDIIRYCYDCIQKQEKTERKLNRETAEKEEEEEWKAEYAKKLEPSEVRIFLSVLSYLPAPYLIVYAHKYELMFPIFSERRGKMGELEPREGRERGGGRGGEGRRCETVRKTGDKFFGLIILVFKTIVFNSVHRKIQ